MHSLDIEVKLFTFIAVDNANFKEEQYTPKEVLLAVPWSSIVVLYDAYFGCRAPVSVQDS